MGGVSPEACWASYKYEINFDTLFHLVGFFIWINKFYWTIQAFLRRESMYIKLQHQSAALLNTLSSEYKEKINFIVCVYPSKLENGHYYVCDITVLQSSIPGKKH